MKIVYHLVRWLVAVGFVVSVGCGVGDLCEATASGVPGTFRLDVYDPRSCACGSPRGTPGDCATSCARSIAEEGAECNDEQTYCTWYTANVDSAILTVNTDGTTTVEQYRAGELKPNLGVSCRLTSENLCDLAIECDNGDEQLLVTWKRIGD